MDGESEPTKLLIKKPFQQNKNQIQSFLSEFQSFNIFLSKSANKRYMVQKLNLSFARFQASCLSSGGISRVAM